MTQHNGPRQIDPGSLRGRIAVKVAGLIKVAARRKDYMRTEAKKQGLTEGQLLAAVITEAVLDVLWMDGDGA